MSLIKKGYLFACAAVLAIAPVATAQWLPDGLPVRATSGHELTPAVVSDGAGGVFVFWFDNRNVVDESDLYAQRIDETGEFLWQPDGIPICTASGNQLSAVAVPDGAGGIIVVWRDDRSTAADVYAQRVDAGGTVLWDTDGAPVCTTSTNAYVRVAVSDGAGGVIVAWDDYRGADADVYAQRLDASGTLLWTTNGVPVVTASGSQSFPRMVSEGAGGAYLAWRDRRSDYLGDVYAQRLDAGGNPKWTVDGIPIDTAPYGPSAIRMVSDGTGGAIIVFNDIRDGSQLDLFAQRVDSLGSIYWTPNGIPVETDPGFSEDQPTCVSDGAGGAVIVFNRSDAGNAMYAQRIDGSGARLWPSGGVAVCTAPAYRSIRDSAPDGAGGIMVTWADHRNGLDDDVYVQRIDAGGTALWGTNGLLLCGAAEDQEEIVVAATGEGEAIVAWTDFRSGDASDVYAQRVENGNWGYPTPAIATVLDVPNDQGGWVRVRFTASNWDVTEAMTPIATYGVWRRIDESALPLVAAAARGEPGVDLILRGTPAFEENDRIVLPPDLAAQAGGFPPGAWELVISVPAMQQPEYYVLCPTQADSSASDTNDNVFVLTVHTTVPSVWFITEPDSGHSVDNIVPTPPSGLVVAYNTEGGVLMSWEASDAPDLDYYRIYRSEQAEFTPSPGDLVYTTIDVEWTDAVEDGWKYYYKVTAVDYAGNESEPASSSSITGVNGTAVPRTFVLHQNVPNPFNPFTRIEFDVPIATNVSIEIFNTRGQRVRVLLDCIVEPGTRSVTWDGTNEAGHRMASGIYFYRLVTPETTRSKKMMLLR